MTTCKLAHTLFWESKKLVFLHCNLLGIIFFRKFLAALWSSLAAQTALGSVATKLNNKFTRKCGYPDNPFIIQNISTEWNSIRNFYKMDKFRHLMVCMIGPLRLLIHILFKVYRLQIRWWIWCQDQMPCLLIISRISPRIHFISVFWHDLHN